MGVLTRVAGALALVGWLIAGHAQPGDRLDRSGLVASFDEDFDGPLRFYDAETRSGVWKTNWFYGDQRAASSRTTGQDIFVDRAYAGIDPFASDDGQVAITLARRPAKRDPKLADARFTSGLLSTERSFAQRYGYFEARMTMPGVAGTWPAFWLYSAAVDRWVGGLDDEIDVVEGQGATPRDTLHSLHRRHAWATVAGGERVDTPQDLSFARTVVDTRGAHVYGIWWNADVLVWYIDDLEVARTPNPGLHSPMYLLLSMGSGGWGANVIAPGFRSAQVRFDFVRAYTLPASAGTR